MIIDFHTHAFPDKIASRAIATLAAGIEKAQGYPALKPKADGTVSGLRRTMEENDIDISVVMPIATNPTQYNSINAFAAQITDDKIISFGSIHPAQDNWRTVLVQLREQGFRGIKLHPEFQDFFVDDSVSCDIVNEAYNLGLTVVFHCGADLGFRPPFHCTPERLCRLLDKTPGTNIVAAHLGGFQMWDEVQHFLVGSPVYMDISMTNGYLEPERLCEIVRSHGADKVFFGSDSPWQLQNASLDILEKSGLTESEKDLIKYKNAMKLLKLD